MVSALERDLIVERREKLTDAQVDELRAAYGAGEKRLDLMKRFDISKSTFYRLLQVVDLENNPTGKQG